MESVNKRMKNEDNCLFIKLPDNLKELNELREIVKGVDVSFNQCPLIRDLYDSANFEGVDVGSNWIIISFILTGVPIAAKSMNWIADFIKKCNDIRIQNRTIRDMDIEYIIKKSQLDDSIIEKTIASIKKGMEDDYKKQCIESFKTINLPGIENITPEDDNKITHCMVTLADLLEKGVEIYPSLDANEELKNLFPKKEEWKKIEGQIKLLEDKNKEN